MPCSAFTDFIPKLGIIIGAKAARLCSLAWSDKSSGSNLCWQRADGWGVGFGCFVHFLMAASWKKKKRTFPVGLTGTVRPQQDHQRVKTPQGACGLGAEVAAWVPRSPRGGFCCGGFAVFSGDGLVLYFPGRLQWSRSKNADILLALWSAPSLPPCG